MRAAVLAIAIVLGAGAVAHAQQPPPPNAHRREEIKKKIRALRAYTLTTELGLDEKAGAKVWPVLAKYDDEIDKLLQQRIDIHRRLAAAGQLPDPKAHDKLVDEAVANQKAFWSVEERRLVELRKLLGPAQVTRLLVVLPGFERKIQRRLQRAIMRPAGRAPDPDDDGDEDDDEPPRGRLRRR